MRRAWIALIAAAACGGTKPRPVAQAAPRVSIEAHLAPSSSNAEPDFAITFAPNFDPPSLGVHVRALDANRVDAILKNESHGKRTMRDLVREWIQSRANMSGADLASVAEGAFDDHAFGKCFRRGPMRFEELDLGFDEQRTRETKTITGVRGAAKLAGLKDGDALVSFRYDEGQAERPVRVVVTRDGKESTITYRPIGRAKNDFGWHVVPGIDPATCSQ